MSLPGETEVEEALAYLSDTDEAYGLHTGQVKSLEYRLKITKATFFLEASGTVAEREAQALACDGYVGFVGLLRDAVIERETMAAKRKTAELTIDVWRSANANRRQGGSF